MNLSSATRALAALIILSMAVVSCRTPRRDRDYPPSSPIGGIPDNPSPDLSKETFFKRPAGEPWVLSEGATLHLDVYRNGGLVHSQPQIVGPDGEIDLGPPAGKVAVAGQRAATALAAIERAFAKVPGGRPPKAHFRHIDDRACVLVTGSASSPGPVSWKRELTVADAIDIAGGAASNASAIEVSSRGRTLILNLGAGGGSQLLAPGDIVRLPR